VESCPPHPEAAKGIPMISDVLFDAIADIRIYLSDQLYRETYSGQLREEIKALVKQMEIVRQKADKPPPGY
jgi:hypothetical protein